jgi:hypothetical protein
MGYDRGWHLREEHAGIAHSARRSGMLSFLESIRFIQGAKNEFLDL